MIKINHSQKKKLISLFILLIFGASTIAFAFLQVFAPGNGDTDVDISTLKYDYPLSNADEAAYLQEDIIVVRFYYSNECEDCSKGNIIVEQIFEDLKDRVLLEKINTDNYSIDKTVPLIELKGSAADSLEIMDYALLRQTACGLFFSEPDTC